MVWKFSEAKKWVSKNMKSLENVTTPVQQLNIIQHLLQPSANFPNNNRLPLIVYKRGLTAVSEHDVRELLDSNRWVNSWVNGVYDYHHFHSTAHEVLAVIGGYAQLQFGGPDGITLHVEQGDVINIPAGVAHKCLSADDDFKIMGAYPEGQKYDIMKGKPDELVKAEKNIKAVPPPVADPVYGTDGPLLKLWHIA